MAVSGRWTVGAALVAAGAAAVSAVVLSGWSTSGGVPGGGLRDLTEAEQIVVERAEETLVERCMERAGFRYWAGPVPDLELRQGNGYVLSDVEWAKKHGYGRELTGKMADLVLGDPNAGYARTLAEPERTRYSEALDGSPDRGVLSVDLPTGGTIRAVRGGCREAAATELYGDFPAWFRARAVATNLTALYAPDIVRDDRFRRAVEAWAACMRAAGHPYPDPPAIREWRDTISESMSPGEIQKVEAEVAVAEATCARDTPLLDTAHALEREHRAQRLTPYREDIDAYQRMGLAALQRAQTITGASR